MKSFWESRTLFSKRVLAAGGSMLLHPLAGQPVDLLCNHGLKYF
jgi:hypothetical protein